MDSCLDHPDLSLHTYADANRRVWHFNVAFIGSCRAGKTKLLQRFVDSQFSDIYSRTAETSFVSKSVSIGRHHVVFQCWDTPGSARSSGCLDPRLDQLHAIFIVFDASRDALADLEHWHHLAMTSATDGGAKPLLVMVANKTDLGSHQGSMTRARDLCRARGGLVFALSVLTDEENLEVDAMMLEVGKALTERHALETSSAAAAAAAVATTTAAAAASAVVMPQFSGDRVESPPSPAPALQSAPPQPILFAPIQAQDAAAADAAAIGVKAEGDGSMAAVAVKADDCGECVSGEGGGGGGDGEGGGKGWWARAVCCCSCW